MGGSFARPLIPDPVVSASYDAANEQLTFGDKTMTYDANGNLTTISEPSGVTTFTWDARNRLVSTHSPDATTAFAYDTLGRRATKQINGSATQYEYDGADITQQVDATGTTTYLRSLNIDEAFSFTNRNGTYFSIYDPLWSTVAATDSTATSLAQYTYDPFGTTFSTNPTFPNFFQYTSREHDLPGLYYYRARYYSASLHRFLAEDPMGPIGGLNRYTYAANNPLRYIDPSGLIPGVPEIPDGLDGVPVDLIAVVFGEAAGQNFSSKLAVANVVNNRVQDTTHEFRNLDSHRKAIYQKNAFESVNKRQFTLAQQVLSGRKTGPVSSDIQNNLALAFYAAQVVYHGTIPDNAGGSLFFYSPIIPRPSYISKGLGVGTLEQFSPRGVSPNDFLFFRYTPR